MKLAFFGILTILMFLWCEFLLLDKDNICNTFHTYFITKCPSIEYATIDTIAQKLQCATHAVDCRFIIISIIIITVIIPMTIIIIFKSHNSACVELYPSSSDKFKGPKRDADIPDVIINLS